MRGMNWTFTNGSVKNTMLNQRKGLGQFCHDGEEGPGPNPQLCRWLRSQMHLHLLMLMLVLAVVRLMLSLKVVRLMLSLKVVRQALRLKVVRLLVLSLKVVRLLMPVRLLLPDQRRHKCRQNGMLE